MLLTATEFVRSIEAVGVVVTPPVDVNALAVVAPELGGWVTFWSGRSKVTDFKIWTISTDTMADTWK